MHHSDSNETPGEKARWRTTQGFFENENSELLRLKTDLVSYSTRGGKVSEIHIVLAVPKIITYFTL